MVVCVSYLVVVVVVQIVVMMMVTNASYLSVEWCVLRDTERTLAMLLRSLTKLSLLARMLSCSLRFSPRTAASMAPPARLAPIEVEEV